MSSRSFVDPDGVAWLAWEVIPGQHGEPDDVRRHLPSGMAEGWLCFQSELGKRRLAPIPPRWRQRSDAELWMYCRVAEPVRPPAEAGGGTASGSAVPA